MIAAERNLTRAAGADMKLLTQNFANNLTKLSPIRRNLTAAAVLDRRNSITTTNNSNALYDTRFYSSVARGLLRFPAFPLKETLNKFIKSAEPLLTDTELKELVKDVSEFEKGDGKQLQKLLEIQAQKDENWLASRWLKTAYLQYRDPVCIYSSPGMKFPTQSFQTDDEYLQYTAKFIYGALKYKQLIDDNQIPEQKMGKFLLDNSQYEKVFGTCRIPGQVEDTLEYAPDSKYAVVAFKNHYFKLPLYTRADRILTPDIIYKELNNIFNINEETGIAYGVLTSTYRDAWGEAYIELISIPGNFSVVKDIQKAMFIVCLDQEVPISKCTEMQVASEQLIHGGGPFQNGANRWFDKTIQIIVNRNGVNGFCYEHSPAEGAPIAVMTDFIVESIATDKNYNLNDITGVDLYEPSFKYELNTSRKLNEAIETAKKSVDQLVKSLHMEVLYYQGYGKNFIKSQKLSPDSLIQVAIQYAFYLIHKVPGPQYESAHLRIYVNGRTETIRSCSNESNAFVKSMSDNKYSNEERIKLLKDAVNGHRQYTNDALLGKAIDRHFLGLKLMATENQIPLPKFFKTKAVIRSSHFRISTSQVASVNESFMCYGPLTSDGYACCYNPRDNDIILAVSSWKSCPETCSNKFVESLRIALDSIEKLLATNYTVPKSKL